MDSLVPATAKGFWSLRQRAMGESHLSKRTVAGFLGDGCSWRNTSQLWHLLTIGYSQDMCEPLRWTYKRWVTWDSRSLQRGGVTQRDLQCQVRLLPAPASSSFIIFLYWHGLECGVYLIPQPTITVYRVYKDYTDYFPITTYSVAKKKTKTLSDGLQNQLASVLHLLFQRTRVGKYAETMKSKICFNSLIWNLDQPLRMLPNCII